MSNRLVPMPTKRAAPRREPVFNEVDEPVISHEHRNEARRRNRVPVGGGVQGHEHPRRWLTQRQVLWTHLHLDRREDPSARGRLLHHSWRLDINREIVEMGAALACPRYSTRYVAFEQADAVAVQPRSTYCVRRSR